MRQVDETGLLIGDSSFLLPAVFGED